MRLGERVPHLFGVALEPLAGSHLTPGEVGGRLRREIDPRSMSDPVSVCDAALLRDPGQLALQPPDLGCFLVAASRLRERLLPRI